jgi:hypothetical protein
MLFTLKQNGNNNIIRERKQNSSNFPQTEREEDEEFLAVNQKFLRHFS